MENSKSFCFFFFGFRPLYLRKPYRPLLSCRQSPTLNFPGLVNHCLVKPGLLQLAKKELLAQSCWPDLSASERIQGEFLQAGKRDLQTRHHLKSREECKKGRHWAPKATATVGLFLDRPPQGT